MGQAYASAPRRATVEGGGFAMNANFKRTTTLYKLAMSYNRGLDRDEDGVACEKA